MEIRLSFGAGFIACFSDINGPKCQGRLSLLQRGCSGSISRRTLTGTSEKETTTHRSGENEREEEAVETARRKGSFEKQGTRVH
ncbi:hypothetical protein PUN28_004770 [Cardiocondyla obscurior]|uniref:Uncharacterized protein n=1 Tax=Cardiocondyla obscurior TaxID=286306 RepID=A0AAW2GEE7_9HYME